MWVVRVDDDEDWGDAHMAVKDVRHDAVDHYWHEWRDSLAPGTYLLLRYDGTLLQLGDND